MGSLLYLATTTRPDLCHAVSHLSRFMDKPSVEHMNVAKAVLKYLRGTVDLGLILGNRIDNRSEALDACTDIFHLTGYSNANYGADKLTRKSTTGYLFFLHGSLISWQSKMQKTVSTSIAQAEYKVAEATVKEALSLKRLINGLNSGG